MFFQDEGAGDDQQQGGDDAPAQPAEGGDDNASE